MMAKLRHVLSADTSDLQRAADVVAGGLEAEQTAVGSLERLLRTQ